MDNLIEKGKKYFEKKEYGEAYECFIKALTRDPTSESAIEYLVKLIKIESDTICSINDVGDELVNTGKTQKALDMYKIFLKKSPVKDGFLKEIGDCYYNLENYVKAIESFKKALKYNPDHQPAMVMGWSSLLALKKYKEAKKWYKKYQEGLRMADCYPRHLYEAIMEEKNAVNIFQELIKDDNKNPELWYYAGLLYKNKKNYKEAVKHLNKAYKLNSKEYDFVKKIIDDIQK
ncbi:MAG: tetratricopeptide repeat protein [Candidatus Thermoplasmatota archaeon]|nr:tetratricopeptide repeat protein [Candidatus Thermoplasmatota archaeon]